MTSQGYWVLTLAAWQLTVGGEVSVPTAAQAVPEPERIISFNLSAGDWRQELELGMDQSATDSLDQMDRALPPSGPVGVEHQAYLIGDQYRWSRDVHPGSEEEIGWRMRVSSPDPVD